MGAGNSTNKNTITGEHSGIKYSIPKNKTYKGKHGNIYTLPHNKTPNVYRGMKVVPRIALTNKIKEEKRQEQEVISQKLKGALGFGGKRTQKNKKKVRFTKKCKSVHKL